MANQNINGAMISTDCGGTPKSEITQTSPIVPTVTCKIIDSKYPPIRMSANKMLVVLLLTAVLPALLLDEYHVTERYVNAVLSIFAEVTGVQRSVRNSLTTTNDLDTLATVPGDGVTNNDLAVFSQPIVQVKQALLAVLEMNVA